MKCRKIPMKNGLPRQYFHGRKFHGMQHSRFHGNDVVLLPPIPCGHYIDRFYFLQARQVHRSYYPLMRSIKKIFRIIKYAIL